MGRATVTSVFTDGRKSTFVISACLVLLTLAVFWRVTNCEFLNYDDGVYVAENPHVLGGLSTDGIRWAFSTCQAGNWHPLTWVSLMADAQVFGPEARGFHLTSLLLHILNVLLLFLLLRRMTGSLWRSAFVAALFAVHPLHVESVAWIAERKDVLSTLLWLLTMLAYTWYARRPSVGRYACVMILFALGLMAKPMLVTLPLVLLMVDYWPLRRSDQSSVISDRSDLPRHPAPGTWRLLLEKIPLLILAVGSSVVTFVAQQATGAVANLDRIPIGLRTENAVVACVSYLWKMLIPIRLSVFYPYPASIPVWQVIGSILVLAAITFAVLRTWHTKPYLAFGWLWYLVTLIPVIGLVQVGAQAMADRYTYVPLFGVFVAVAWLMVDGKPNVQRSTFNIQRPTAITVGCIVVVAMALLSYQQVAHWQDSRTLFAHAAGVTRDNYLAYSNLGVALYHEGNVEEAAEQFAEAVRIKPEHAPAQAGLGMSLMQLGQVDQAIEHLSAAVRLDKNLADAHNGLGVLLAGQGKHAKAVEHYREALRADSENPDTHYNIAASLAETGRLTEAAEEYTEAIRLRPDDAQAHNNLGIVLMRMGRRQDAANAFKAALEIDPGYGNAQDNLARALGVKP